MYVNRYQGLKRIQKQHMLDPLNLLILSNILQTMRQHLMPIRNQVRNNGSSILRPSGQYLMPISHTYRIASILVLLHDIPA